MSKTPSTILSDALASFNRAATLALTAAQEQARKDVTQATTDSRDARRERDEAVKALHSLRLEEQAWKQEVGVWKAAVEQADLTINHHLETIAQLRQEAIQWKNQCLRLEETSRQEAISWKEQFLRVEQERSKLAQRLDELLAEQLGSSGHAQTSATPYTPMPKYSAIGDLSASARLQGNSAIDSLSPRLKELPPSKSAFSSKTNSSVRTRPVLNLQLPTPSTENQRGARQRAIQGSIPSVSVPGSSSNGTRQILVRRVRAIVEVPVKEESAEPGVGVDTHISSSVPAVASASTSVSTSASVPNVSEALSRTAELSKATPRVKRKLSVKRSYVEIDESEQDTKQSDAEEHQPVSDDDDELLMGVEPNRKEVYGMKRAPKLTSFHKSTRPLIAAKKRKVPPPAKKSRTSTTAS